MLESNPLSSTEVFHNFFVVIEFRLIMVVAYITGKRYVFTNILMFALFQPLKVGRISYEYRLHNFIFTILILWRERCILLPDQICLSKASFDSFGILGCVFSSKEIKRVYIFSLDQIKNMIGIIWSINTWIHV